MREGQGRGWAGRPEVPCTGGAAPRKPDGSQETPPPPPPSQDVPGEGAAGIEGEAQTGSMTLYEVVLTNPDCLGLIVQYATEYPMGSTAKVHCVAKAWRRASRLLPQPLGLQRVVLDVIRALESASIEERGVECMACDSEPELYQGKPAASCRCCGAPIRLAGLNDRQDGRWCDFMGHSTPSLRIRTAPLSGIYTDYEEFDAWLLWDMYEHPDQAVPVRRKFWKREGTLPEGAGVEAG